MTTECHLVACKYHDCNSGNPHDEGPFCQEPECPPDAECFKLVVPEHVGETTNPAPVQKFRVHTFQVMRVPYEVEAASQEEAAKAVYDRADNETGEEPPIYRCADAEDAGEWQPDMIVDPILPDGTVDYDNVKTVIYSPQEDPAKNWDLSTRR